MMNLLFTDDEVLFQEMQVKWNEIPDAIYKDHYSLEKLSTYNAGSWRQFMAHPAVQDWINQETVALQQAKYRSLLKDLDGNSRSTGLPQLMNTLQNALGSKVEDTGPIFIYTYVPLTEEEKHAPNVRIAKHNIIEDLLEIG